jgi:hypothetical protein
VQVLEHEHARPDGSKTLEVAAPSREQLLPLRRTRFEAYERCQTLQQPLSLEVLREERRLQLCGSHFGGIRLEDACLGLHDLPERPKRDPFAVRQAASLPPADEPGLRVDVAEELGHEPALAHTRLAHDRHQLHRPLLRRALEDPDQKRLL